MGKDSDKASRHVGKRPTVSIVIPVRNRSRLILRALDSVYAQTFRDFEIIVVDDGSTDDTPAAIKSYSRPLRLIVREQTGVSAARNAGIAQARGDYIAFLDSDDWFEPTKLEKQVAFFAGHPRTGLVYTRYSVFDEYSEKQWTYTGGLSSQGDAFRDLLMGFMDTPLTTPTVMVRREVFETIAPFDATMHMAEDIDLWCRIADCFEFGFIDEPLSVIRYHTGNTSGRTTAMENLQIWTAIARKHFSRRDPRLNFWFRQRVWAKIYWTIAEQRRLNSGGTWNWHHVKSLLTRPSQEMVLSALKWIKRGTIG